VGYDIVNILAYKYIYYIYQNIMYIKILKTRLYIGENNTRTVLRDKFNVIMKS